ncbi:MAG: 3D domain-containing protein [Pyrinomonadaceae bacterium]
MPRVSSLQTDRLAYYHLARVRLDAGSYSGEYTVADTGGLVRGRKIDIWMPCNIEARRFGRRQIKLTVLSYGRRSPRQKVKSYLVRN